MRIHLTNHGFNKKNIILIGLVMVMLFPLGLMNGYIPYFVVGLLFVISLATNGYVVGLKNSFLLFTAYSFAQSSIISPLYVNFDTLAAVKGSLFVLMPFFYIQIGKNLHRMKRKELCNITMLILTVESLVGLLQVSRGFFSNILYRLYMPSAGTYISDVSWFRGVGTFGNPNAYAMGVCVLCAICLNLTNKKACRFASIALMFLSVLASKSRTGIVLAVVVLGIYFFYGKKIDVKKVVIAVIFPVFLLIGYYIYMRSVGRNIDFGGLSSRFAMWTNLFEEVNNYSLDKRILTYLFGAGSAYIKNRSAVDNEYIFVLLSNGIVGLSMFIIYIIQMINQFRRIKYEQIKKLGYTLIIIWLLAAITSSFMYVYLVAAFVFIIFGMASKDNCELFVTEPMDYKEIMKGHKICLSANTSYR